jgi:putative hydrolase of the HAD superfamily
MFAQSVELPIRWPGLRNGKKIAVSVLFPLNNEGKELNDYRVKKFKLHECFDAFVSSCEVKMRKPDPGIWQLAMGIAQASPQQCVYFDDRMMFVNTAQKLGIRSFQHTDFETTKKILEDLKKENGWFINWLLASPWSSPKERVQKSILTKTMKLKPLLWRGFR